VSAGRRPGSERRIGRLEDDGSPTGLQRITIAGRTAILAAIAVGALGFVLSFEWFASNWPGSFPLLLAFVPGALGAAAAFGLARLALRLTGVPFHVEDVE